LPINLVEVVSDRGVKNRIVTKSHPGLLLAAAELRQRVFNFIKRDKRLKHVLNGDREKALENMMLGGMDNTLLSADLTAATDRFDLGQAKQLW